MDVESKEKPKLIPEVNVLKVGAFSHFVFFTHDVNCIRATAHALPSRPHVVRQARGCITVHLVCIALSFGLTVKTHAELQHSGFKFLLQSVELLGEMCGIFSNSS